MANRTFTFRLSQEGVLELQRNLNSLGEEGAAAFLQLEKAAPGFGAALEASAEKAEAARKRMEASIKAELSDIFGLLDGAVQKSDASFKSLRASLDPAYAAQQEFARGQEIVNEALKRNPELAGEAAKVNALLEQQFRRSTTTANGFATGMTTVTRVLGAFGVAVSASAAINVGKQIFEDTAALVDQAKQLQQTLASLQAVRAEFRQGGSTEADADKALAKVNELAGQAADNIGNARRELSEWNIDWRELAQVAPEQRLAVIVRGLLAIEDSGRRAYAQQQIFGKEGREVTTVMEGLAAGIDQVIEKQDRLGNIKSDKWAQDAKKASDQLAQSWTNLKTAATPSVVFVSTSLSGWLLLINKVVDGIGKIPKAMADAQGSFRYMPGQVNPDLSNPPSPETRFKTLHTVNTAADNKALGLPAPRATNENFNAWLDVQREEARLAGMTAAKRAEITMMIAGANQALQGGLQNHALQAEYAGKTSLSYADALKILSPAEQAEVRRLAAIRSSSEYAEKLKVTYAKFIADYAEESRLAGETVVQRNTEMAIIQAAQVVQKERGVLERNLVQTYVAARKELGEVRAAEVETAAAARARNELARDVLQPLRDEVSLVGKTREEREQELELLRLKQQYGEAAVKLSEEELRNLLRKRDEMAGDDMIEDMRDRLRLSSMTREEAERESAVLQAMRATHGNLREDQAAEIRQLVDMQREAEKVVGIAEEGRDVVANWFEKGKIDLADIPRLFKRVAAQMAADALMSPIIFPMVGQMMGGMGGGTGGAISSLLGGSSGMGLNPMMGMSAMNTITGYGGGTGLFGTGNMFGGLGLVDGIGSMLGFGTSAMAGSAGAAMALPTMSVAMPGLGGAMGSMTIAPGAVSGALPGLAGAPGSIFGATTLGGFMGGVGLGSLASSLVFGNKNDAGMGGMGGALAGAAIGSIIPGVGTIIGGLAGGLLGGGLGSMTGSSNQGAIANFGGDGTTSYLFKQGGGNNGQLASGAAQQVSAIISALAAQGVTVGMNGITGLSIGSDKSYVYDSNGGKQKLAGGDVEGVVSAVLERILPSASGGTAAAQAVIGKYMSSGGINSGNLSQLTSDLGFANTLSNLDFSVKQLTQSEQLLKQINDQYQGVIDKARTLGLETANVEAARAAAIQGVVDQFDEAVASAIQQISDPMQAAADALSAQQAQRIKEATTLGANLNEVLRLNALETEQLTRAQQGQLSSTEGLLSQAAALAKQAAEFNDNVRIQILGFSDPLQAALDTEANAGKQRVDQAKAIGADLVKVEELNGLMRKKILDDYAAQARQAAEAAAREAEAAKAQLENSLIAARSNLAGLVANLTYGNDSAASPEQKYFSALANYSAAKEAVTGNPNDPLAIASYQQAASTFAPIARDFLGSSQAYGRISNDILSTATRLGGDLADPSGYGRAIVMATTNGSGAIVDALGITNSRLDAMDQNFASLARLMTAFLNRKTG